MTLSGGSAEYLSPDNGDPGSPSAWSWSFALPVVCLVWYFIVLSVCGIGYIQLWLNYSSAPRPAISAKLPASEVPHVTILRPVKGQEPELYECLSSTFRQVYPRDKLTVYFCISSVDDPAYPTLKRVLEDFPGFDAKILVEAEDDHVSTLGPNPKIRNLSRGYREAKGDIVWVIDCNVWVGKGVAGRMVDKLCGFAQDGGTARRYKFVHQLPLVVDISMWRSAGAQKEAVKRGQSSSVQIHSTSTESYDITDSSSTYYREPTLLSRGGGRLEELFLSSSHAKFYTAINTVLIAPCIVGKSNMFRRSHLSQLTASDPKKGSGIDFFSDNICEDHLIGDLLWKGKVAEEKGGEKLGKHALVFGDLAIQPMAHMSVKEYVARRVRWLRVRKFTVTLATMVEPGTESLLCSLYGAYAVSAIPKIAHAIPLTSSWAIFVSFWIISVVLWACVDWTVYLKLHSAASIEIDEYSPHFVRRPRGTSGRPFREWLMAWLGREILAFPVWAWAVLGGTTVVWRGHKFWVGTDMRVHEIQRPERAGAANGHGHGKIRTE
ncbi:MAG: hypothetical protein M4579_003436 [Chaenotheca gracillima]|nr:MAG: hypothetical protein M4579_003436 [Chaenotheca gracillima]